MKHKAETTLKLSHPSLPGPSPVDSERYHDQSVGLHDKILSGLLSTERLPTSPGDLGPNSDHAYQSITDMVHVNMGQLCSRSTKVSVKYQSVLVAETHTYNQEGWIQHHHVNQLWKVS